MIRMEAQEKDTTVPISRMPRCKIRHVERDAISVAVFTFKLYQDISDCLVAYIEEAAVIP